MVKIKLSDLNKKDICTYKEKGKVVRFLFVDTSCGDKEPTPVDVDMFLKKLGIEIVDDTVSRTMCRNSVKICEKPTDLV